MDTKLEPKLAMWVDGFTYFHPWVHKVAQVVPNGAQSGSKGAQSLPKWSQNAAQGLQNVGPRAPMGGFPLRYIYMCICSSVFLLKGS